MLIYILFFCLLITLVASFFIYKKDVIEPPIILTASYTLSVLCAWVNIEKWGINFSGKAFWIILLGTLEFILVSYCINFLFKKKNKVSNNSSEDVEKERGKDGIIDVPKFITIAIIIYNVIIIALLVHNVLKIASCFGQYSSFSEALTIYKQHTSYANDMQLPDYLTVIMKPIIASAYVYTFFFIKNVIYTEEKKYKVALKYSYYLIPALTYFIQKFAESNRGSILNFIVSAIVMYFVMVNVHGNWKKHVNLKTLIKLGCSGAICLVLFYLSTTLVGRINSKGLVDYITCYCGGSIECFNLYAQEDDEIRTMPGEDTFKSPIEDLKKLGIIDKDKEVVSEAPFRFYKDNLIGNVYTSYKRWMHDFGIPGIIVLQALMAIIFSVAYNIIRYWKKSKRLRDLFVIIYSYFMYTIFMHPIDSLFYLETFTFYTCGVMLFIILAYWVLTINVRYNIKKKKYDKENIKILCVTPGLNLCGGIESYSMNYYRNINSNIHMDFVTHEIKDEDYKKEIENNGDNVFLLKPIGIKNIIINLIEINKFFKEHNDYDIIHCNMANAAIFYFYFARKYNIDIRILHSHQNDYADKFTHKLRNVPLIYLGKKYATANFACSKIAGDFLFKKDSYYIINNAIDVTRYKYNEETRKKIREKLQIKDDEVVIGTIGRLTEQKNQIFLINILKELKQNSNYYKLIIVGDGEAKEYLEENVEQMNLKENVIFVGSVNNVQDYLQAFDIFVLPSLYEGLGIVNIEAQASGLPTIVSDKVPEEANITDLIKYISLDDGINIWAENITNTKLNENREIYNEKVQETNYNIKTQARELEKIYMQLIVEENGTRKEI